MESNKIKQTSNQFIMNTYGRFDAALIKGIGATAYDENNKEYIDFGSGIGVNCLGFCNEGFVNAVTTQLNSIQHTSNLYYTEPSATLAETLCSVSHFKKAFFCNSGAEANECAIKLARKFSFDNFPNSDKNQIVTLKNSFHGRTITTLSATGQDHFHNHFFPFTEGFCYIEPNNTEQIKTIDIKKTCAVMVECIQGEGGVNVLDYNYVKTLESFCKQNNILLIVDEVQTGIGRTGKLFAFEHYNIEPDIITLAKGLGGGLPIGACLCSKKLEDTLSPATHGTTFGANPVTTAGANYILSVVNNADFLNQVNKKGEYIVKEISRLKNVEKINYKGLMIGIELKGITAKDTAVKCLENGLLVLTAQNNLRLLPPLNISYKEIDKGLQVLKNILDF